MRKWIVCLSFLCSSLVADPQDPYVHAVTEGDPTENICNSVNLLTGDFVTFSEDLVVEGVEPIHLKRFYVSGDGRGKNSGWEFFPHLILESITGSGNEEHHRIKVAEPNGSLLIYKRVKIPNQWPTYLINFEKHGKGITNISQGAISGRTNLKNQVVYITNKEDIKICTSEGGVRWYKVNKKDPNFFLLQAEQLPNQHWIAYTYDKFHRLTSIRTMNAQKTKTFAWCNIIYHGMPEQTHDFHIQTSDGKSLQYLFQTEIAREVGELGQSEENLQSEKFWVLKDMTSSERAPEKQEYYASAGFGLTGPLMKSRRLPDGRQIKAEYYQKYEDKASEVNKVKKLLLPLEKNAKLITAFQFFYDMAKEKIKHKKYKYSENGRTDILDIYGNWTKVHYTPQFLPFRTEYYDQGTLHHAIEAQWGECGQLTRKRYLASNDQEVMAKEFLYDIKGNIIEEQLIGDLCGNGLRDVYKKRFSYDGNNLLIHQEEDNGLNIDYTYIPSSNLLISKIISDGKEILIREFFDYDEDHLLIRKIIDDGKDRDRSSLKGVTERKIEAITRRQDQPAIGFPETIEERALDLTSGHERLLKKTILIYSPENRIIRKDLYDANNAFCFSLHTHYDPMGRPVEEIDSLGQTTKKSFDVHGNKVYEEASSGKKMHFSYDSMNRLVQEVHENESGEKRTTTHEYDLRNRRAKTVDPFGNPTSYEYDAFDHCTRIIYPQKEQDDNKTHSIEERFVYDIMGRQTEIINANGVRTYKRYNAYGEPAEISYADGTKEIFTYYSNGKLKNHTNQEGLTVLHIYDVLDREIKRTYIDAQGNDLSEEKFVYNAFHLLQETNKEGTVTYYTYDFAGRKIKEEKAGLIAEYIYDARGRMHIQKNGELLSFFEYDSLGRVIEERQESTSGDLLAKVLYQFNAQNLKTHITSFIQGSASTQIATFDAFGRLLKEKDPLGNTIIHQYHEAFSNALGQRVLQIVSYDPLGRKTTQIFDVFGKLSILEKRDARDQLLLQEHYFYDPSQNLICQKTSVYEEGYFLYVLSTRLEYDLFNRKIAVYEADGQKVTRFTYTPAGKLYQTIKPDGVILTYTYDGLGYPLSLSSSDGSVHYTYTHNLEGHLLASYDQVQHKQTIHEVDAHGRILKETLMNGLILQNNYDDLGRRTHLTLPDASTINYTYDALHLRKVSYDRYEHTYSYDLSGQICEEGLPKQLDKVVYSYDLKGRAVKVKNRFFEEKVTFDPCGNILARVMDQEERRYAYDQLDQLSQEDGKFSHQFRSDSLNNRRTKDNHNYELNALNQLLVSDTCQYTYDLNGNPIEERTAKSSRHFVYDALDRLVEVRQDKEFKLVFTYDNFHRRISKKHYLWYVWGWSEQDTQYYFYDNQNEIGSTNKHGTIQELRVLGYAPNAERRAAVLIRINGYDYIPIHDLQGNVIKLNYKGVVSQSYAYSAFGEESLQSPPISPWRYSSKRTDPETNLIFFGRRYYNPSTGRFITPDPEGFTDGLNLYAYVHNNPLIYFDLYGLYFIEERDTGATLATERTESNNTRVNENNNYQNSSNNRNLPVISEFIVEIDSRVDVFVFQTGGHEHPERMSIFMNGIMNTPEDAKASAYYLSNLADQHNIRAICTPTKGFANDIAGAIAELKFRKETPTTRELANWIATFTSIGFKEFCLVPHSRACITTRNYLAKQSNKVRNTISVVAIAPAAYIPREYCKDVVHYRSKNDFVPTIDKSGNHMDNVYTLDPHPEAKGQDHEFVSPTYRNVLRKHLNNFLETGDIR